MQGVCATITCFVIILAVITVRKIKKVTFELDDCPDFTGKPGLDITGKVDLSVFPQKTWNPLYWRYPCMLDSHVTYSLASGSESDYKEIEKHWLLIETGHIISKLPNHTVGMRLDLRCCYDTFQWSCLIPHKVVSSKRLNENENENNNNNNNNISKRKLSSFDNKERNPHPFAMFLLFLFFEILYSFCLAFCFWIVIYFNSLLNYLSYP